MINLDQILAQYPPHLRMYPESILKEYLQYKILQSIFSSPSTEKLAFLGGTALRILYGNPRFSEDLDFDNFQCSIQEFEALGTLIQKDLRREGLDVDIASVTANAYRLKIRIPEVLFHAGLSPLLQQRILIQVDTLPQHFSYSPEKVFLNKFDVFTQINAVPKDILLAQKLFASVNRKRLMGRDFFDIVFLYGMGVQPNFAYLQQKIDIEDAKALKDYMRVKTATLDFEALAMDVEPFLFDARDKKKVLLFREFVEATL